MNKDSLVTLCFKLLYKQANKQIKTLPKIFTTDTVIYYITLMNLNHTL